MRDRIKAHAPVLITAAVVSALTAGGPAIATAAFDAMNAHKVDGKHAVGAGASINDRAGKLVATGRSGHLPNNIIVRAPDSARLGGLRLNEVRTQWLSVTAGGTIYGSSPAAASVSVTHPATGTYCVSDNGINTTSVSGNVQSQVDGFEDLTMIVTSLYNTSACPGEIRIYTANAGALYDTPFTLTFALN